MPQMWSETTQFNLRLNNNCFARSLSSIQRDRPDLARATDSHTLLMRAETLQLARLKAALIF